MANRHASTSARLGLAGIELDDEVGFHHDRIWYIRELRNASEADGHLIVIRFEIVWHVALGALHGFQHEDEAARLFAHFDDIALAQR